jgi:hypothetical protein
MAGYNTASDSANTAIRAFIAKVDTARENIFSALLCTVVLRQLMVFTSILESPSSGQ